MAVINYISMASAQEIHRLTIMHSGGGVYEHLDLGRLDSVLTNIQNDEYYPTFADKLTHLFYCTCQFHCFADGNKRLAITLSAQFLLINGYMSIAKHFFEVTENITLSAQFLLINGYMSIAKHFFEVTENISYQVAAGKIDKELLHRILTAILKGTYDEDEELKLDLFHAIDG